MEALKEKTDRSMKLTKVSYNPFDSGPVLKAAPTTRAQKEILASITMDDKATLCYNEALVIEFAGEIDLEILNRAFIRIIERHDALRMVLSKNGQMFSIQPNRHHFFDFIDLSEEKDAEEKFSDLCRNEVTNPFNLFDGPCFRATVVKLAAQKFSFLLSAHHVVCDGWSFGVILKEMAEFYTIMTENKFPEHKSAASFVDHALRESHEISEKQREYWLKEFQTLHDREMPTDHIRSDFRSFKSKRIDFRVPEGTVRMIRQFSSQEKCSFYNTLMTTFSLLLSRLLKQNQVVVGLASAHQAFTGEYDLTGHLVNLLPLKTELQPELTFAENLKHVRRKMLDAFENQSFAYGDIVRSATHLSRKPGQLPLLDVVFNIDQQLSPDELNFAGIQASYRTIPRDYENFEIFINAVSAGDQLILECQYNSELYELSTITRWLQTYADLLSRLPELRNEKLADIAIENLFLPAPEVQELITVSENQTLSAPRLVNAAEFKAEEDILLAIWKDVLNREVSRVDHFFSIGGHSLLAVEVQRLVESKTGIKLQMKDIFSKPVLSDLAARVGELKGNNRQRNLPDLLPSGKTSGPLSMNQMQIWYLEETHSQTIMHNLPAALRIKDEVDLQVLTRAFRLLIERHPSMRTSFRLENGMPVQVIKPAELINFKVGFKKIREDQLQSALDQEAGIVFDTEKAPLFRATLYELSATEHVLFFMVHHSIWDGWSFDIFFEELDLAYRNIMAGKIPDFKTSPVINCLDFTLWQEELLKDGYLNEDLEYWKKELLQPLPVLNLPQDYTRPVKMNHEGGTFAFNLKDNEAYIVREYAKLNGVSLFNVFLTAFKLTLLIHDEQATKSGDVIVGMPVRGRTHASIMQTIGFFVNTVALRTKLNPFASFEENLAIVTEKCQQALDHQLYPFSLLINQLSLPRDNSRSPVFQSFFSFQDVSNRTSQFNGKKYTQVNVDRASTHTDLDLWIKASDGKIEGAFEYRKDLFASETIKRFSEVFFNLINNLLISIKKPLSLKDYIPTDHVNLMLNEWNNTDVKRPFSSLAELFSDAARKNAAKTAVVSESCKLTYEELDNLSFRLATSLRNKNIKAGDLVGVSLGRDHNLLVALMAVVRLGAVYVPLDPFFPRDRLHYMVKDSGPKLIITQDKNLFSESDVQLATFDELFSMEGIANLPSFARVKKDDLLYVIYTSGTTGNPKGVQVRQGSVVNFLLGMKEKGLFSSKDKLLAVTTLSFDIAVLELFLPLICGGTVVLAQSHQVIDGDALKHLIETHDISTLQATPSTWRLLLASGWTGKNTFRALCGGEAFPQDLVAQLVPICKEVWNMYGPTESTVWSACRKIENIKDRVTVGRGIANTRVYILNEKKEMNPVGVSGEIYIAGDGLALGYRNRDELTREKFVKDPFFADQKMYATGDLGRFTKDGEIICLGRNDSQIKMRGYRIELGEIEARLMTLPELREACVLAVEINNDLRLIAYVSLKNKHVNETEIKSSLSKHLPPYMIPAHFVFLNELPKTLNGKIDRKAMPEFKTSEKISSQEMVKISNQIESLVLKIFRETLMNENLQLADNFFEAGGHSLLAVTLIGKLNRETGKIIPLSALVESKTMADFCKGLDTDVLQRNVQSTHPTPVKIYRSLVTLRETGEANPLYFFHSVGGNVLNYVGLIPAAREKRPVFAFQSLGMDGLSRPLGSIEEMASYYIKELKLTQPRGPYILAGGSMGGMIAFEVARQLQQSGDRVEKLIMLDTFGPNLQLQNYQSEMVSGFWQRTINFLHYRKELILMSFQEAVHRFMGLQIPLPLMLKLIERENYKALWKFKPRSFDGDLHLIRSNSAHSWYSDPVMGWKGVIRGNIHTYRIKGSHSDFIESPQLVDVLSKLLN